MRATLKTSQLFINCLALSASTKYFFESSQIAPDIKQGKKAPLKCCFLNIFISLIDRGIFPVDEKSEIAASTSFTIS